MRLPGFEPGLEAWKAGQNQELDSIEATLHAFKEFCQVDLRRKESTIRLHVGVMKRFFTHARKPLHQIDESDIRSYLKGYLTKSSSAYADQIKAFRIFFRDFLDKGDMVSTFRLPSHTYTPKIVPTKQQLRQFYKALTSVRDQALFLLYASTGLRKAELLTLTINDIDRAQHMILPNNHENGTTKRSWVSFYNMEAHSALEKYLQGNSNDHGTLFSMSSKTMLKTWKKATKQTGIRITPKVLRDWFCSELGKLGVQDRYVDAFCGRTPKSVLARHYTDYSPQRLKEIYDNARLTVLQ